MIPELQVRDTGQSLPGLTEARDPVRARSLQSRRARGRRRQVTELRRGVPVQATI